MRAGVFVLLAAVVCGRIRAAPDADAGDTLAAMSADQAAAYLSCIFAREGWIAAQ